MQSTQDEEMDSAAFEVPLNTVIDCLNIFGTAGPASSSTGGGGSGGNKRWRKHDEGSGRESGEEDEARGRGRRIEPFMLGGSEKRTGMRMSYAGGYPLTLVMYDCVSFAGVHWG